MDLVSPFILPGQSPYMILQNHPKIPYSEKTLYNYIESGALSIKNIDLPKKVKYKIRSSDSSGPADKAIYEGRTYKDLQAFLKEFPDTRTLYSSVKDPTKRCSLSIFPVALL